MKFIVYRINRNNERHWLSMFPSKIAAKDEAKQCSIESSCVYIVTDMNDNIVYRFKDGKNEIE